MCRFVVVASLLVMATARAAAQVHVDVTPERVAVAIDGKPFTALHTSKSVRKVFLHPVLTASGKRVTRAFPMETVAGESTDHPHQRGIWIGAERVSGVDFWENEPSYENPAIGTVALREVVDVRSGAREGAFTMLADWITPKGETVIVERRTMEFRGRGDGQRMIDIDLRLTAKQRVTFDDNHDAILGLRLGTAFEEGHGGRAVNAEGVAGWERLRGSRSAWVDWHAEVDGEKVGVAVMDAPTNFRHPTRWHVRDYALLFASPFASRDYSPEAPDWSVTLQPGNELRLRYRILVHPASVDVASAFKEYASSLTGGTDEMDGLSLRTSVVVTGRATDVAGVSEPGQTIDAEEIADLPSLTRSSAKLALLNPHVRHVLALGADFQDSNRLSINASSYRHTGYTLDGTTTYDWIYGNGPQVAVSPGAVREMNVLVGEFSAQHGLSTTGVLSITTASGSDRLRGEAFTFVRPSGLQALPPLATVHVPNERTDWGFNAGGPLRRGRTYFFGSYERADQDRGAFIQSPRPELFIGVTREQYALARVDHRVNDRHALTVRANASEYTTTNANDRVAGFNQASFGRRSRTQSVGGQVSERAVFDDAANELRASFVAYVPDSAAPLHTSVQVVRPNYGTEGFSTSNWVHARSIQIGNLFTVQPGRHSLRFGGELAHVHARDYSLTPVGTYTFAPGPPQAGEPPLIYSQTFGAVDLTYGQTQVSAFAEDEIRLSSRLSARAGVRYEVQSITDARLNLAPRLAISWDVSGDQRTIIRGGAGIFYDQYYMYLTRRFITLGPQSPQAAYTWSWGDPGFPAFPDSLSSVPTGKLAGARDIMIPGDPLRNPYSVQLSVSIDRELGSGLALQVRGFQAHTHRQMRVNDINHPEPFARTIPGQVRTPQAANQTRPSSTFDGVAVRDIARIDNSAESVYRSLDIGLTKRAARHGHFSLHYVASSSTAYSMFYADANSGVPDEWWNNWDRFERGPSDFHQPHRFVGTASIALPFDANLSVVSTAASGLPVNPVTGRDNNGDSYTVDRPIGLGRNSFRGPAQLSTDVVASKRLQLTSRVRTELRLEIFNLFNRENFVRVNNIFGEGPLPLATFLAPIAGIANADPSRQLQFAVRMLF